MMAVPMATVKKHYISFCERAAEGPMSGVFHLQEEIQIVAALGRVNLTLDSTDKEEIGKTEKQSLVILYSNMVWSEDASHI
ncbi:unnamed protein product [Caretta caretta]